MCIRMGLRAKGKGRLKRRCRSERKSRVLASRSRSKDPVFAARRDGACSRFEKKKEWETKENGCCSIVDVWWHLPPRTGDCAGGCKIVPEVTLCRQSPRVRFLFRRRPAAGRRAWWNRLSFLGKCSSAAYLGRPVQVCGKAHNSVIESHWQSFTMDANGGVHPAGKSRSRARQSDHCEHYLLPCVFTVIISWFICRRAFLSRVAGHRGVSLSGSWRAVFLRGGGKCHY